ncbi:hypothetical protein F5Y10DRAFT_258686 [Nemania abortiva]|nr:hypothetical protein F5Y10DRAFT_258686 [Nemania abortiva]
MIEASFKTNSSISYTRERIMADIMTTEPGASAPVANDRLDGLEKVVHEEIESGYYMKFNIHVACAQKPRM